MYFTYFVVMIVEYGECGCAISQTIIDANDLQSSDEERTMFLNW